MEAKELRLNNWVMYGNTYPIVKGKFFEIDCLDIMKAETLEPIPLSEEWLLNLGFEKGDDILGDCFYIERQYIDDFVIHHYKNTSFEFFPYDVTVTHVHQLQNLFYALTGEELTFND